MLLAFVPSLRPGAPLPRHQIWGRAASATARHGNGHGRGPSTTRRPGSVRTERRRGADRVEARGRRCRRSAQGERVASSMGKVAVAVLEQPGLPELPALELRREDGDVLALLRGELVVKLLLDRPFRARAPALLEELHGALLERDRDPEQVRRVVGTVIDAGV